MTTAVSSQPSTTTIPPASSNGSVSASSAAQRLSSLDEPAISPPRDFAEEARQISRNFERAQRAGENYQRFEPATTIITNPDGTTTEVPADPAETARNAIREFEQQQRNRNRRAIAERPESPAQRLLSVERQNVNVLVAERSAANALSSLANTLNIAQSNASNFYDDFRASNGVRTTGGIGISRRV